MTENKQLTDWEVHLETNFTTADVRGFVLLMTSDIKQLQKIKKYQVARGKWNLKVTQEKVKGLKILLKHQLFNLL